MKVIVIGAGVIGVTTAYFLNKEGYEVEVYDSHAGPAKGTSFANAGQISVGYSAPWAGPGIPFKAIKWLTKRNAPFDFEFDGTVDQIKWVAQFLSNCTNEKYKTNKAAMLRISQCSQESLRDIRNQTGIQYEGRQGGTLQLFRTEKQFKDSTKDMECLVRAGIDYTWINCRSELLKYEPGLAHDYADLFGGLYIPGDETGDCNKFCIELEKICVARGVKFHYADKVKSLVIRNGKCVGIEHDYGSSYGNYIEFADKVVVAAGVYSKELLKGIQNIPVYPVRGHSLTVDITNSAAAPVSTILDETNKVAITRFDNRIRAGGFAELAGYSTKPKYNGWFRFMQLRNLVDELYPDATDDWTHSDLINQKDSQFWTGLRPMTPNGIPLIGSTKMDGLYLNTGHGTLGWTMACGSAEILTTILSGKLKNV